MFIEATSEIASRITGAIRDAARATGSSFDYLLRTAQRESNFDPTAKASTSSATGLFQFIDQTWLETLKTAGPELGYGRYAEDIVQTSSGQYVVPDATQRQAIMQLRNDPAVASAMAGAFTKRNAAVLTERLGRKPTDGELYIAHFLGPSGASHLISTAAARPQAKAADLFPDAAAANRSIFYRRGAPRTVSQVYDLLVAKHGSATAPVLASSARNAVAAVTSAVKDNGPPTRSPLAIADVGPPGSTPRVRQASAFASDPVFHTLFRSEDRGPVSSMVSELWTAKSVQFPDRLPTATAAAPAAVRPGSKALAAPLDLFKFLRPEVKTPGGRSA